MTSEGSKRRDFLSLVFITKSISKRLLIKILKRDNQLHLFRRLEQCSIKQVNFETAVEFLKLCQNFDLTPTFARVDKTKSEKWNRSSAAFEQNVVSEELRQKTKHLPELRREIREVYREIQEECLPLRFICILKTIVFLRNEQYQQQMSVHTKKIARLLNADTNIDEHIKNISSYRLSFFQKLVLCRGLNFALPQRISSREIHATFEKAYWKLEPKLEDSNERELAAATLRSIALNYSERKGPTPPKAMLRAISQLKKRDDIVITKPDKGSGVVIMDKSDYVRLLKESSINDEEKFAPVSLERPRTRGRPPKFYHPLLQKEKELTSTVQKILPKNIADSVVQKGSRLAHLYGLPKTHKKKLAMRPILSATGTYNYKLAKWLDEKLKPLSVNDHTVGDIFVFADELREMKIKEHDVLVSYDVSSLFTNVPVDETIESIAERAFEKDWFNKEHDLNITKQALIELLRIATKNQLFQFEGNLYEQVDGVAMGSPLGPLMANAFMCNIEKQLETENKMPAFYKRYVDDTLSAMPDVEAAIDFLTTLNNSHPSIDFTMELEENGRLPFLGMNLSSTWKTFHEECERLKEIFSRLCYPEDHVQSTIRLFVDSQVSEESRTHVDEKRGDPIRVVLPFKDQKSANAVRRQLADLSRKISADITPVYTSKKIKEEIRVREEKPPLVSQQCVVYQFKCDLCDAGYVGYTCRHLHQRIEEHKGATIGDHLREKHALEPNNIAKSLRILRKCQNKFDCLVFEMFL
ncbi:uncharacterized protein [Montipora foliosa]|uniref:uncharacterized protein n=1 Tax=Montipora foliosa TaxID=591990 RepID=UPI0035F1473F